MILLTRLIDLVVRGVHSLGGRNGRILQSFAWMFVVVLGAGVTLVAIGVAHIDDLVDVLENSAASVPGEGTPQ
ncbi:hypothetical protein [Rhodococcus phenolicus]|uniref:hypothetical protein n=1 Tax=Rhodococcus phenolicus TaxID=263849 RepID=UPI000AC413CD|nr:hypothetical protein [Rhodococcus phenolicus]